MAETCTTQYFKSLLSMKSGNMGLVLQRICLVLQRMCLVLQHICLVLLHICLVLQRMYLVLNIDLVPNMKLLDIW